MNQNFRDLLVWQRAHQLALSTYRVTASFPRDEVYGLTGQMRRAASSITANLAEGCGRGGRAELARFTQMARGSASELECHLLLANDLDYLAAPDFKRLHSDIHEVQRMLTAFRQSLLAAGESTGPDSRLRTQD